MKVLSLAGPLSAFLAYAITGFNLYCVINSLGEMATYLPLPGAVPVFAARFVDPVCKLLNLLTTLANAADFLLSGAGICAGLELLLPARDRDTDRNDCKRDYNWVLAE